MPVIVSHAQIQSVKDALAGVRSNGQALAAVNAATKMATDLAEHLSAEGGAIRAGAAHDLDEYSKRVDVQRKQLDGNLQGAVGPSWLKAREQIFNLYMLAFTLESTMPPGTDFGDGWGPALSYAVKELPRTIGEAAKVAAKVVNTAVTEVAKIGGSVVWGVVKGAWPLLLILGIGAGVFFFVKGKVVKTAVGA